MYLVNIYGYVPDSILGGENYGKWDYTMPWCRGGAFYVGIACGWLWISGTLGPSPIVPKDMEKKENAPVLEDSASAACSSSSSSSSSSNEQTLQEKKTFMTRVCNAVLRESKLLGWAIGIIALSGMLFVTFAHVWFYQGCSFQDCGSADKSPASKSFIYFWAGFSRLIWSLGIGAILILTSQKTKTGSTGRFLPLLQSGLTQDFWQPLAKLAYSTYLIHVVILIWFYCSMGSPVEFN